MKRNKIKSYTNMKANSYQLKCKKLWINKKQNTKNKLKIYKKKKKIQLPKLKLVMI